MNKKMIRQVLPCMHYSKPAFSMTAFRSQLQEARDPFPLSRFFQLERLHAAHTLQISLLVQGQVMSLLALGRPLFRNAPRFSAGMAQMKCHGIQTPVSCYLYVCMTLSAIGLLTCGFMPLICRLAFSLVCRRFGHSIRTMKRFAQVTKHHKFST